VNRKNTLEADMAHALVLDLIILMASPPASYLIMHVHVLGLSSSTMARY
jgi:hypothetical protein